MTKGGQSREPSTHLRVLRASALAVAGTGTLTAAGNGAH
jgi:hypothetical protein